MFIKQRHVTQLAVCSSNLKNIYTALYELQATNLNRFSWRDQRYLPGKDKPAEVWFYMGHIKDYLSSPKVLVCPADDKRPAVDWSTNVTSMANANVQDKAVSYFLGVDCLPFRPGILLGDRNVVVTEKSACSLRFNANLPTLERNNAREGRVGWEQNLLHKTVGQIALMSGGIKKVNSQGLADLVISTDGDSSWRNHILPPGLKDQ